MLGSLYSGASGVKTHSNAMTVTGSNIANVNTVGYKYNRVNFEDLLSTSLIGNTDTKIGKGVSIGTVQNVQTQGSFEQTELNTDLAIDGDGFFTLRDREGNLFYTRAGHFEYDKEGYLTTRDGKYLQVKDVDPIDKNSFGNLKRINILDQRDPPTPTGAGVLDGTGVEIKANLDANAISPEMDLDLNNVETGMYNFSTSVSVIDQLGNEHTLNIVFGKMEDQPEQIDPATQQPIPGSEIRNTWQWLVLSPGEDIEGGVAGTLKAVGGGFLRFGNDGRLISEIPGEIRIPPLDPTAPPESPPNPPELFPIAKDPNQPVTQIGFNFAGTGVQQTIGFKFGKESNPQDPADRRTGLDGITQFASDFAVHSAFADGMKSGAIENILITEYGNIEGSFDSGNTRTLGRVILTDFKAAEKLLKKGNNLYRQSYESGPPIEDDPKKNGFGAIRSKSLEHSNVELSEEFVKIIEGQRAFQANAKTVTTSDEMLADLIQMKR